MTTSSHRRRPAGARDRRGATAVFVVIVLVVLMGFTAFAVDFGRLYAFRAQLQTTADAAALAGAVELMRGRPGLATGVAIDYAGRNLVERQLAFVPPDSVIPGTWQDGEFTPMPGSWANPVVNAVQVRAHYTANYIFAPVLGRFIKNISAVAVGAVGSPTSSRCMKPWAIPYENVLYALRGRGVPMDTSYDLLPEDVEYLRTNRSTIIFNMAAPGQSDTTITDGAGRPIPGNYYPVRYPPSHDPQQNPYTALGSPDPGGAQYRANIAGNCTSAPVGLGDYLEIENGVMRGPTTQGVRAMCGLSPTGSPNFSCNRDIQLPIWAGRARLSGPGNVQVRYIGAFRLTEYRNGSARGYLTAIDAPGGGFSTEPGPVQKSAMVY